MKKFFFVVVATMMLAPLSAKVWRVNPNSGIDADFKSVQEALDAANKNDQGAVESLIVADGDTLYCEPGSYGNVTISRPITLIGAGFGDITNGVQLGTENCAVFTSNITLKANNINLIGLVCNNSIHENSFKNENNTTVYPEYCSIERCKTTRIDLEDSKYTTVKNCYITGDVFVNQAQFINNVLLFSSGSFVDFMYARNSTVSNNTIINLKHSTLNGCNGSTITDNIMLFNSASAAPDFTDNTVHNNIIAITGSEAYETYPNNIYGTNNTEESLFELEGEYGAKYKIKEGHRALTYSTPGGEIGAYGGNFPFEPSMRPLGMPYIYDVTVEQDNENQTIQLNFKAKSQNE